MIRTATLGLMACGQPDGQDGGVAVGETVAGAPTAAQQILEVDMDAGRQLAGGPEYVFYGPSASMDYGRRLVLVLEIGRPGPVSMQRPSRMPR